MSEKEMEHMNSIYKKLKTIKFEIIIVSIALFVLGLLLVIFPTASQEIICKGIGVALCVWGVFRLINYFRIAGSEILGSYGLVPVSYTHLDVYKRQTQDSRRHHLLADVLISSTRSTEYQTINFEIKVEVFRDLNFF